MEKETTTERDKNGSGSEDGEGEKTRSGVEWSRADWSGVEWIGVEWIGVEWSGVARAAFIPLHPSLPPSPHPKDTRRAE